MKSKRIKNLFIFFYYLKSKIIIDEFVKWRYLKHLKLQILIHLIILRMMM